MIEPLTVRIDQKLNAAFRRKCQALNEPVDKIVERLIQTFLDESRFIGTNTMFCDAPKIDRFLKELVKDVKVSDDESFFGDLTYDEYFALSDSEREALWSQGYRQELDRKQSKEKEKEANPDAIPAGQGHSAEIRRRIRKQRTRRTPDR